MSGSVNKVILIGNLGADPEVRQTAGGQAVATLSIATSERFKDRDGQERTEWHRVVVWGKLAELAQRYLQKGRKVFVEGRIQTRSWDDQQTGQKRYSTEIVANELTFLDGGAGRQGQTREESPRAQGGQADGRASGRQAPQSPPDEPGYFDNDVPF
jgi:single-strand DNA-binding protein